MIANIWLRAKAWWGSLFNNPGMTQALIAVFAIVLIFATATKCHGSEIEWSAGSTIVRQESAVIKFDIVWPKAGPIDTDYKCGLVLVGAYLKGEGRNNAAVQCQIVDGFGKFDIGLGVAVLQHTDALNGSNANFALSLGYCWFDCRLTATYNHWSNAGTVKPNTGRDFITIGWRFR